VHRRVANVWRAARRKTFPRPWQFVASKLLPAADSRTDWLKLREAQHHARQQLGTMKGLHQVPRHMRGTCIDCHIEDQRSGQMSDAKPALVRNSITRRTKSSDLTQNASCPCTSRHAAMRPRSCSFARHHLVYRTLTSTCHLYIFAAVN
jgi:hypothetical protein